MKHSTLHIPRLLPLTLALLLPAPCAQAAPPPPNFADLPGYFRALNQSADPAAAAIRAQIAAGPADLVRERELAEKVGLRTRPVQMQPPLPPAGQNAAPLYVQLDALRRRNPLHLPLYAQPLGSDAYTPGQIAIVQKEVDAHQDLFTLLHQAADKPQCVFARDYSGSLNGNAFTNYQALRENAREINTESILLAYQGDFPQAAANQERGFRIASQIASEPDLISYLVGTAIDSLTLSGMQTILKKAGPNAALDRRISADIVALPPLSLRHALSGEAALTDANFSRLRHATPAELYQAGSDSFLPLAGHPPSASAQFTPQEQTQLGLLLDAAEADYLHDLRLFAPVADAPRPTRQALLAQMTASAQANPNNPVDAFTSAFVGEISKISDNAFVPARRIVTAAGTAVLAAKAQTGAFPAALPGWFTDPYTGKPLGYHLEGADGFVVYSAGPDSTFDGGKPGEKTPPQESLFRYLPVPLSSSANVLK